MVYFQVSVKTSKRGIVVAVIIIRFPRASRVGFCGNGAGLQTRWAFKRYLKSWVRKSWKRSKLRRTGRVAAQIPAARPAESVAQPPERLPVE